MIEKNPGLKKYSASEPSLPELKTIRKEICNAETDSEYKYDFP